ncbi:centromere protein O [Nematostella vectensis]|uniref:centromere protein O n=1 Tax=Nematostella vectensis TaxID=45351 RepID=UPI002076D6BE|nr:centromere protein O [Nematostella vectensis]
MAPKKKTKRAKPNIASEEGLLYDLERLQQREERIKKHQELETTEEQEISELKKKVQQLRKKRDKLLQQKEEGCGKVLQEYIGMTKSEGVAAANSSVNKEDVLNAATTLMIRKLADLCELYRLTGLSIASKENNRICFRLDTFFKCQYHEPYYVEIQANPNLKIIKHSLPYFIPLDKVAGEYLNTNIQKFFSELGIYLNALVSRREQMNLLWSEHSSKLDGDVTNSPAYDLIQFTLRISNGQEKESSISIKLCYDDFKCTLPSSVSYHVKQEEPPVQLDVEIFKTKYIHRAVRDLVPEDSNE